MELDQIIQMLKGKTEIKLVKFISDKGPGSCEECLKHHGEVFQLDDPNKPKLPIHPNCRCKYELLTPNEVVSYQGEVQKINQAAEVIHKEMKKELDEILKKYRKYQKSY